MTFRAAPDASAGVGQQRARVGALAPPDAPADGATPAPASAVYRAVWRWHFYAGLVCMPFLVLLAITGSLYLFRDEIEAVLDRDLLFVPAAAAGAAPLAPERLVDAAVQAWPGQATRYLPPAAPGRSAEIGVQGLDGAAASVYVDPVTARVLGGRRDDRKPMHIVRRLHSLAIAGPVANHAVEIVAGWAIVLVVTGTCLWWPRGRRGGIVSVRATPARRLWWRDLHAVTGAAAAAIVLFLAVTGMPWSAFWGQQFGRVTNALGVGVPAFVWARQPASRLAPAGEVDGPWTLRDAPVPQSQRPPPIAAPAHQHGAMAVAAARTRPESIGLNAAMATFAQLGLQAGFEVTLPAGDHGVYTLRHFPDDVRQARVVHLDQYSGEPLVDIGYADYGVVGKVTDWGISLHTGRQFGLPNQLVMLIGCLAVVALAVTSCVMWWKRRPRTRLAAPRRAPGDRLPRGVLAGIVALGLLYPLLGASMLAALLVDAAVPARWHERFGL